MINSKCRGTFYFDLSRELVLKTSEGLPEGFMKVLTLLLHSVE